MSGSIPKPASSRRRTMVDVDLAREFAEALIAMYEVEGAECAHGYGFEDDCPEPDCAWNPLIRPALRKATALLVDNAMRPGAPRWVEFFDRLQGPEGCDFKEEPVEDGEPKIAWRCGGGYDRTYARAILEAMGYDEAYIERSFAFFDEHGGHCDCEILFNVASV